MLGIFHVIIMNVGLDTKALLKYHKSGPYNLHITLHYIHFLKSYDRFEEQTDTQVIHLFSCCQL